MVSVDRIVNLVRFKQHDQAKTVYSDYEIIESLNECIRHINRSYALKNADFLEAQAVIDEAAANAVIDEKWASITGWGRLWGQYFGGMPPEEQRGHVHLLTGMDLPSDFVTLISINTIKHLQPYSPAAVGERLKFGEYRISGNKLYCGAKAVTINYKRRIAEVDTESEGVDLPEDFIDLLVKGTGLVLTNADTDILMAEVNRALEAIVPSRRYSHIKSKMPFMV